MKRAIHLIPLCLQTLIWWAALRAFPVYFANEEEAFAAIFNGRPLPGITQLLLQASHIPQAIPFEWSYISAFATATYFFSGFMLLFSTADLPSAIQRSYVYQITCTTTLAFVSTLAFIAALLPFVSALQELGLAEPKSVTTREIFWTVLTWTYLLFLALIAGWRLRGFLRRSKNRPK